MADNEPLSVRAIKGKFEQLQDASCGGGSQGASSKSPSGRRRRAAHPPPADVAHRKDSPLLAPQEVADETSTQKFKSFADKDSRLRSQSVGNWSPSSGFERGRREAISVDKLNRNHSVSRSKEKTNEMEGEESRTQFPNNNFSSFSEKQRLVESIVMNIKNSAGNTKRKNLQSKEYNKSKEIFNITSKFEKDLKNVLEREVRKKWNPKLSKEEKHLKEDQEKAGIIAKREEICNRVIGISHKKSFSKINSILGVELYPIRPSVSDDIPPKDSDQNETNNNYPIHKSESSPIMFNKSNDRAKTKPKVEIHHYFTNCRPNENALCERQNIRHSSRLPEEDCAVPSPRDQSPVRPPRRRRVKKAKAPLPPSPEYGSKNNNYLAQSDNTDLQEQGSESVFTEIDDSYNDNSAFFSLSGDSTRRLSCELSKGSDYEDRCERSLEGETFLYEKESLENTFNGSFNVSHSKRNETMSPSKWMSVSDSSLGVRTSPLPMGGPPKKPPRTFAYDIYRSLQVEKSEKPQFCSTPKLTPEEVESLYTKPLKRFKEKQAFPSSPSRNKDVRTNKPTIAPKPLDIVNKVKMRLSVVEPLPSVVESSEYSDHDKRSIKRNSSFRFSFRKLKKNSPSPPRQEGRKDNQMGRRFKAVARNLHPKKHDVEKRARFQSKCNTENIYNDIEGGPIYATPDSQRDFRPKEHPEELHYMCSPLFPNESEAGLKVGEVALKGEVKESQKENLPPPPPSPEDESRGRLGLMDGIKEELRQSCRLVQKRWKGGATQLKHGR